MGKSPWQPGFSDEGYTHCLRVYEVLSERSPDNQMRILAEEPGTVFGRMRAATVGGDEFDVEVTDD